MIDRGLPGITYSEIPLSCVGGRPHDGGPQFHRPTTEFLCGGEGERERRKRCRFFREILGEDKSARQAFNGPDRTITWKPWHQSPQGEYRFRTGDRYLGREVWEHYLCFEQNRSSGKAIKLFMIHLGNEDVREQVEIRPGLRYAFVKVTDGTMTAHKGGSGIPKALIGSK